MRELANYLSHSITHGDVIDGEHLEPSLSDPADEFFSRKPDREAAVFFFLPGFFQDLLIRAQIWKRGRDI